MRIVLLASAAALALGGCTSTSNGSADNDDTAMSGSNMNMGNGMAGTGGMGDSMSANAGGMAAVPVDTPMFVATAAMSDKYEIEAGRIAAKMATDPAVKRFGQQMVEAHTGTTAALKSAAAKDSVAMTPPAALDDKHRTLIDALNSADKASFDDVYKAQQRQAHTETLALMQSYAASGDKPAIRSFAAETAPKVKMHLDMLTRMN